MNIRKKQKKIIATQQEGSLNNPWKAYTCKELVHLVMNGTKEAFAGLYIRYIDLVIVVCNNIVNDWVAAEDLAGSAYCRAMESMDQFSTSRDNFSFKKWILKIAISFSCNYLRRKKLEKETFKSHLIQEAVDIEETKSYQDNLIQTENSYIISNALASLRLLTRQCIEGVYWHDLTYDDLMNIYGLKKDQVAYHMKYGRRHLLEKLEGWFEGNENL